MRNSIESRLLNEKIIIILFKFYKNGNRHKQNDESIFIDLVLGGSIITLRFIMFNRLSFRPVLSISQSICCTLIVMQRKYLS